MERFAPKSLLMNKIASMSLPKNVLQVSHSYLLLDQNTLKVEPELNIYKTKIDQKKKVEPQLNIYKTKVEQKKKVEPQLNIYKTKVDQKKKVESQLNIYKTKVDQKKKQII